MGDRLDVISRVSHVLSTKSPLHSSLKQTRCRMCYALFRRVVIPSGTNKGGKIYVVKTAYRPNI